MNNDDKAKTLEPDIPATSTGSTLQETKSPEVGTEDIKPAPTVAEALQSVEVIEQQVNPDETPSSSI